MLTVREIQSRTTAFFRSREVPDPKLDTDLLIAHVLGLRRLDLYLELERPVTAAQLDELRPLVRRRGQREPLQYILGACDFCGWPLKVDKRALIPRLETEELVDLILNQLESPPERILDLGTGSGAIALALFKAFPDAAVTAVDQSAEAIALARENAATLVPKGPLRFLCGSWFEPLNQGETFDLIISNPPYLSAEEMQSAQPEVAKYEPPSALASGSDGVEDLQKILGQAQAYLNKGGMLALETGIAQHKRLREIASGAGWMRTEEHADMSGRPRFFFAFK